MHFIWHRGQLIILLRLPIPQIDVWEVLVILFVQLLEQDVQKSIVICRIHETETDIFVV